MSLKVDSCPPKGPDKEYMDRVARTLELWGARMENPGPVVAASLNLPNLQTDGWALRIGDVFAEHNVSAGTAFYLRIVRAGETYVRGASATGAVGSVTTTP